MELYDNQIKKPENLSGLVNLKMLDVSHNMLRRIEGLEGLVRGEFLTYVSHPVSGSEMLMGHEDWLQIYSLQLGEVVLGVQQDLKD